MSNVLVAVLFALGAAGWIYMKISRQTGGNVKSSAVTAAISGVLLFLLLFMILTAIF